MEKAQDMQNLFIELNTFLRIMGAATTGGRAKLIIRAGEVKVNAIVETKNKRKLHAGDTVDYLGKKYEVDKKYVR